eukprot:CAMPEP_0115759810 /NCGR_PEP_ID=MMETSP0272-20121206/99664_1 /TAXON_ID=71861 /ORGANISM="Scrippsiella trochoidea, Strain CCMP3099" /LENGTH=96 /DNA_ID=CAMNT_0003205433 /DNA_START=747 /DNA_END=1033 /DNA_ORIENTATION=+
MRDHRTLRARWVRSPFYVWQCARAILQLERAHLHRRARGLPSRHVGLPTEGVVVRSAGIQHAQIKGQDVSTSSTAVQALGNHWVRREANRGQSSNA